MRTFGIFDESSILLMPKSKVLLYLLNNELIIENSK